jgi:hypothetical protein
MIEQSTASYITRSKPPWKHNGTRKHTINAVHAALPLSAAFAGTGKVIHQPTARRRAESLKLDLDHHPSAIIVTGTIHSSGVACSVRSYEWGIDSSETPNRGLMTAAPGLVRFQGCTGFRTLRLMPSRRREPAVFQQHECYVAEN